ncbi:predicted protein [Plenodomus lingam JN3]|uniref:Predicted protein n=1 Tax=Leptosphaeria maculans (strain JN3 / isolate v23.1.3 / race Av1-4-5-6-7-8) TaxID=985895 RepID=E5A8S9_LEPMJ|nr:predicted protein [Plenodomus lingam JN3]CBY00024.1 predicted protein [Plenodomus lingam JN3]
MLFGASDTPRRTRRATISVGGQGTYSRLVLMRPGANAIQLPVCMCAAASVTFRWGTER